MNNWIILILGATGDLARKRLIPALYNLWGRPLFEHQKEHLNFIFIGAAKDNIEIDDLLDDVHTNIKKLNHTAWCEFKQNAYYLTLNFENLDDFKKLAVKIEELEKTFKGQGRTSRVKRLAYLATSSEFYCLITQNLIESEIIRKAEYDSDSIETCDRIVYEKPFGWDLKTAETLNSCLSELLIENQIYRVDHYLTKALVDSILPIRFSNIIFEPIWNNEFIDHIQIILSETETIDGRGKFYDRYGALKDVVQNHLFQILAFLTMEKPSKLDSDERSTRGKFRVQVPEIDQINQAKAQVLKNLSIVDGLLGQYEGYLEENDVKKDSKTETFAILKCILQNKRWSNVPFYLKTGKCLNVKSTEIHVVFKKINENANILTIRISPNAQLSVKLNVKRRDETIVPINMEFCYRCYFGYHVPRSYEFLLSEVMSGDRNVSINWNQIKYAWELIREIENKKFPLYFYKCGVKGPKESELFAKKYNFEWLL